ncbi:uncharacterized protein L969DRAFT_93877 [Mixia osmundae IAM 14324]|uniref:Uncharacterized protein n=1 Tax=Mixia osmundae (strain CBS 9802 / IAM 14324 / JCM 22182 / KY 12970) TaxID=764103 RepID=G7E9U6_MIXOS|nr:uncharacterized protein L969DRAFT_93877 [Mixia osmundae IAM 14324]KEI40048.1 hypothetical protein L969DRAFT_93877 [Mixia osmundae IAM 14324]GAA99415.1 hypothetical protein E5Q_06113 [Mixia osmundae IAM 14324]
MAQGFKTKPLAKPVKSSAGQRNKANAPLKKGNRVIPPQRKVAVEEAVRRKNVSTSINTRLEGAMAQRASAGKLTIMKKSAQQAASAASEKPRKGPARTPKRPAMPHSYAVAMRRCDANCVAVASQLALPCLAVLLECSQVSIARKMKGTLAVFSALFSSALATSVGHYEAPTAGQVFNLNCPTMTIRLVGLPADALYVDVSMTHSNKMGVATHYDVGQAAIISGVFSAVFEWVDESTTPGQWTLVSEISHKDGSLNSTDIDIVVVDTTDPCE